MIRRRSGAGAHEGLPGCDARIVQVPAVTIVTSVPETVHTAGVSDAKATARPLLAVAEIAMGSPP